MINAIVPFRNIPVDYCMGMNTVNDNNNDKA